MRRYGQVIAVMCLCQLIITVDVSMVGMVLPQIGRDLRVSDAALSWVISANLLTIAGFQLLAGRITDAIGQRRSLLLSLITYSVGSVLAALAPSLVVLLIARVLSGFALAVVNPASFSLINTAIPEGHERRLALGAYGTAQGVALVLGLVLAGVIADHLGWRGAFWINVPFAAIALILALRSVPPPVSRERLSLVAAPSAVLITVAIGCLTWSVSETSASGISSVSTIALGIAVLSLGLFVVSERVAREALIPLSVFKCRGFVGGALGNFFVMAGTAPVFVLPNLYMQENLAMPGSAAGFGMAPLALACIVAGYLVSAAMKRWPLVLVGMGGFACATIGSLALAAGAAFGGYLLPVACGGIFVAAGFTVALVVVMGAATAEVPAPQQGTASGIAIMTQNIGSSIGVAIALGILSASSLNGRPPSLASYQVSYLIMAAMTASGFLVTWLAIRRGERLETTPVSG